MRQRLAALLAVPQDRDARVFAVAAVIDALGNGLFLPVSALFFVKVAGLPTTRVGLGLSIAGVVALIGPLLSGPPVDAYGPRRTMLVLCGLRAVCYGLYPFVRGFWPFVSLVAVTEAANTMSRPTMQALVATLADDADRMTTLAFVRAVRNVGYGLGGLGVSVALAFGGRGPYVTLVLADAATFVVALVLLAQVSEHRPVRVVGAPVIGYRAVLRDRRFLALTAVHGVLTLHLSLLLVGFPLWIDQRTKAPTAMAGVIFTVNSALVVLLQVPFSRRSVTVAEGGKALWRSGVAAAATCLLLVVTPGLGAPVAVVVLLLIGVVQCAAELWEAAGGWAVSLGLAPEEARGRYLGVWALGLAFPDVIGPALVAWIVVHAGGPGWIGLAVVLLLAGALARRLASRVPDAAQPPPERLDPVDDRVHHGDPVPDEPV